MTTHFRKKARQLCLRRRILIAAVGLLMMFALAGCTKTGRLDEGNSKLTISLIDIPKEFSMLEENIQDNFEIRLILKSISNERLYHITLDQQNDFRQEVSLHPGTYQVYSLVTNQSANTMASVSADAESVTLSSDKLSTLHIFINNQEAFTEHWMAVQPLPEMLLADPYDGLIQVNRRIFDLHAEDSSALLAQFDLHNDKNQPVAAYKKIEVSDSTAGVTLTLQNQTDSPLDWRSCRVVGILVTKNNVVFPQGVTLGMATSNVCHDETGLYGAPDKFTGSLLYGWALDHTYAVYNDPDTGDRITLGLRLSDSSIQSIRYELALFE